MTFSHRCSSLPSPAVKIALAVLTGLAIVLAGCQPDNRSAPTSNPRVLRIGLLPHQSADQTRAEFEPLFAFVSERIGHPHELVIGHSYAELLRLFHEGKIDLAFFGGITYLMAARNDGAMPLAMRDIDTRFVSAFVVRADSTARSLEDMKGTVLAFGSSLSTSGHVMPRYFLERRGIHPESFFRKIVHTGGHDRTAYAVRDGQADVGVLDPDVLDAMTSDGRMDPGQLRMLWMTPPYPNYVIAVRADLDRRLCDTIRDALLALGMDNPGQAAILRRLNAGYFLPASPQDFKPLLEAASSLGLMPGPTKTKTWR